MHKKRRDTTDQSRTQVACSKDYNAHENLRSVFVVVVVVVVVFCTYTVREEFAQRQERDYALSKTRRKVPQPSQKERVQSA